jgi:hypothetical protein
MTLERYDAPADAPSLMDAAAAAGSPELEDFLLAELQAMRVARKNIQVWIRRLSEEAGKESWPRPSRYRCRRAR